MTINLKRYLLSGLVAGFIILLVGFGLVPVIGDQMNDVLKNFSLPPLSPAAMAFFAFVSLANGMALTGFYLLFEPHFKSRLNAVIMTSLIFWFIAYFLSGASLVAYGFMPLKLTAFGTCWGILEVSIACYVSSRIYNRKS